MKRMVLGTLLGLGLVTAAIAVAEQRGEVYAQHTTPVAATPAAAGSELIVVPTSLGEKGQMLTVVDPRQRVLSVYHIDLSNGKISLKSVRNIQWDLQMAYLNNESPLPQEIRSLLEQR
jgi:predicted methyltransferase